jgi:hypothetical protein
MIRILFLIFPFTVFGQEINKQNFWSSILISKSITEKVNVSADFGFRTCDQFVHAKRTALGRFIIDRKLNSLFSVGLGYAFFEHYGNLTKPENRIFGQLILQKESQKIETTIRLRNEVRFYNRNSEILNRTRLQINLKSKHLTKFQPAFGFEYFFTPGNSKLHETRTATQLNFILNDLTTIQSFYILQYQSNTPYFQHIAGIQIQFKIN